MISVIAGLSGLGGSLAVAKAALWDGDTARDRLAARAGVAGIERAGRSAPLPPDAARVADADADGANVGKAPIEDTVELSTEGQQAARRAETARYAAMPDEKQKEMIEKLRKRDREVRAHEAAHKAAGGQYAGSATFSYQVGPDGQQYAVGGEVPIDLSPVPGDPAATIRKMQQVQAAALAPAEPSSADRQVAAKAAQIAARARAELSRSSSATPGGPQDEPADPADAEAVAAFRSAFESQSLIDVYA